MKSFRILLFVFLSGLTISPACAASEWDDDEVRTYKVSDFNKIHLEGSYRIIIEQSDKPGLKVRADEEAFKYIDVDSDDELLNLEITKDHFDFERVELYITVKDLTKLHIEGGARLETKGYLDLDNFYVHVEGGAKVEMEMKVNELTVVGEGGVIFTFEGVANHMDARISGAGHLDAEMLKTKNVDIEIEGVGTGTVYATDKLKASIEGVGKIKYKGNPEVDKHIEGIGFISND